MVNRKIDRYLVEFYRNTRKALMLTGARQIGKTFSIRKFGEEHFDSFVDTSVPFRDYQKFINALF